MVVRRGGGGRARGWSLTRQPINKKENDDHTTAVYYHMHRSSSPLLAVRVKCARPWYYSITVVGSTWQYCTTVQ